MSIFFPPIVMNDQHQPLLSFLQVTPFIEQTTWGAQYQQDMWPHFRM